MAYRSTHDARRELADLAATQGGYFTAKQAASAGYGKRHVDYHVRTGNFQRVERGLFRLPGILPSEHDDLIRLSLWSRGRDDAPRAVVSHETALGVHDLGGLLPTRTHLTVPRGFRKKAPPGCVLHKAELRGHDVEVREGFSVTIPVRTLVDVARDVTVSQEQLVEIVQQATDRGMVRRAKLVEAVKEHPDVARLSTALASVER